jgi:YidC/Oxa1 family membrane protein insertase
MLPLMIKQIKSTKGMQLIQPEMKKLQGKYSSKDQATQQKLQQEMMALYKEHGVNPMAGCLPLLIQMPILFGFYHAIMRTQEISQQSFLWFDLGAKDPYFILPIVAAITTFLSQKISMTGTANDNVQMKMMLYIMPAMILFAGISLPSALGLYWVIGNIFTIFQTIAIKGPELRQSSKK